MVAYIFREIAQKGRASGRTPGAEESRSWFRNQAKSIGHVNEDRLMKSVKRLYARITPNDIGRMQMFFYDAKTKDDLPYWDKFPLIFVVETYSDGFLGINLHYLPLTLRAKLMDALYTIETQDNQRRTKKLELSYKLLKGASKFRLFSPCVKRYLNSHVKSRFLHIPYNHWDTALFLPTERFVKASKRKVHNDSRRSLKQKYGKL